MVVELAAECLVSCFAESMCRKVKWDGKGLVLDDGS